MLRRFSSITVPSLCLVLSACADEGPDAADGLGTDGTDGTQDTSTGDGDGDAGDGDGDGDVGDGDGDTGSASCPPVGPFGTEVGDTIDNMVFFRSTGEPLALHDGCGASQPALLLFGTASW